MYPTRGADTSASAAAEEEQVLSQFTIEQFSEGATVEGQGGWQKVGGGGGGSGGGFRKQLKKRDITKRLRQLLGNGNIMSEEQVSNLNAATLMQLKPVERQQFYRFGSNNCTILLSNYCT